MPARERAAGVAKNKNKKTKQPANPGPNSFEKLAAIEQYDELLLGLFRQNEWECVTLSQLGKMPGYHKPKAVGKMRQFVAHSKYFQITVDNEESVLRFRPSYYSYYGMFSVTGTVYLEWGCCSTTHMACLQPLELRAWG